MDSVRKRPDNWNEGGGERVHDFGSQKQYDQDSDYSRQRYGRNTNGQYQDTDSKQHYDLDMFSRRRVDREELAAQIEASNRTADRVLASFNDPIIRTFSSGLTGRPSAPPQPSQQLTTGYHAAPRRESASAPRHDFHDRDCDDQPRRDALLDVWYDPSSAHRHSGFLETAVEADDRRTVSAKREMTGTPVAANKKQKMGAEIETSAFQAALVTEGVDGTQDSELPADGAVIGVGEDTQASELGEVVTTVQPTWGSSKNRLEAIIDEAMGKGKGDATFDSIWKKAQDWAAEDDDDDMKAYYDVVCRLAITKWARKSILELKNRLDRIRTSAYKSLAGEGETQLSCVYTEWYTLVLTHRHLVPQREFEELNRRRVIKTMSLQQNNGPPFDERFRDYLQKNMPAPAQPSSSTARPPEEAPPASLVPIPLRAYKEGAVVRPTQQSQPQSQPVSRNMAWPRDPAGQVEVSVPKLQQMLDLIQAAGLGITTRLGWQPFVMQIPINRSASRCWETQRLIIEVNDLLQNKGVKFAWNGAFQLTFRLETRDVGIEETAYLAYLWRFVVMPYHEHLRSHGNKPLAKFVNAKLRQLGPEHYWTNTNAALVGIATAIQRRDVRSVAVEASAFPLPSSRRRAPPNQGFPYNGHRGRRGRRGGRGSSDRETSWNR